MSFGKADAEQKKENITKLIRQAQTGLLLEDKSSTLMQKGSRYGNTITKENVFQAPQFSFVFFCCFFIVALVILVLQLQTFFYIS